VSWSVVATVVLLPVGLHIHQRTKFQFLAQLVSEIWLFKNLKKVGIAYTLDAPSRKMCTCSPCVNAKQHTKFLFPTLITFGNIEGHQNKNVGLLISPDTKDKIFHMQR